MSKEEASFLIKNEAGKIGFGACGIAAIAPASTEALFFDRWIACAAHAGMKYMENYRELRLNPGLLVEGARTVISLALNYYPPTLQSPDIPQIAYYAYGEDYHTVMRAKMEQLLYYIREKILPFYPDLEFQGRCFTDSAPILERYWAWKAGLGWIGKNTNLIIPGKGSFFFLGEIITSMELSYDSPMEKNRCGSCTRCLDACPTGALERLGYLNANKCLSYLTIENKGDIPQEQASALGNRLYGCDTCQKVCPWNRFATPTAVNEFFPNPSLLALDKESVKHLTRDEYNRIFKRSAVKRAKYEGLMRTSKLL